MKHRLLYLVLRITVLLFIIELVFFFGKTGMTTAIASGYLGESETFQKEDGIYQNVTSSVNEMIQYDLFEDRAKIKAQAEAWNLLALYADPEMYLEDPYVTGSDGYYDYSRHQFSQALQEEFKKISDQICAEADTDYEKMYIIQKYVAENIYYDNDFFDGESDETFVHPDDVWRTKVSVCAGYARLVRTLLIQQNIPCMNVYGENHEYNIAYDRQAKRWVFIDATWASGNSYSKADGFIKGEYRQEFFDANLQKRARMHNHEIYNLYDLNYLDGNYWLDTDREDWNNIGKWKLEKQEHAGRQIQ